MARLSVIERYFVNIVCYSIMDSIPGKIHESSFSRDKKIK